jgi:hypothetical protein
MAVEPAASRSIVVTKPVLVAAILFSKTLRWPSRVIACAGNEVAVRNPLHALGSENVGDRGLYRLKLRIRSVMRQSWRDWRW